jgi:hypothetical protein
VVSVVHRRGSGLIPHTPLIIESDPAHHHAIRCSPLPTPPAADVGRLSVLWRRQCFLQVAGYVLSDVMCDATIVQRSQFEHGDGVGHFQVRDRGMTGFRIHRRHTHTICGCRIHTRYDWVR